MIRTVADFLLQFKEEEANKLDSIELNHGPTIGDMYEGLSKDLLSRAVPTALGLQLVSGFIIDGLGNMSGQIDCMLVRGSGESIPYTNDYKWHIKDVIAVLEIKKSLYGADLADAFDHLRMVEDLEFNYMQFRWNESEIVDVRSAQRAFAAITGLAAPSTGDELNRLGIRDQLIFHTLTHEQLCAIRIILGYDGFQTERGFRQSLMNRLTDQIGVLGYGVSGFPQLIISGQYSLVKANGQPILAPLQNGKWPFYFSSSTNPLQIMLEYIWTRLDLEFHVGGLWGDDLTQVALKGFLLATVEEKSGRLGWMYTYLDTDNTALKDADDYVEWEPSHLSIEQFVAIQRLCEGRTVKFDDQELIFYLTAKGLEVDQFKEDLLRTGLVATMGNELRLITDECQCAILPTGEFIAAENNTGRLTRWIQRRLKQESPKEPD